MTQMKPDLGTLHSAWEHTIQGVQEANMAALNEGRGILADMAKPTTPEQSFIYGAGHLALAHWPIFEAWTKNSDVTRNVIDEVRTNILIDPMLTLPGVAHSFITSQAVTSLLLPRPVEPEEPVSHITYPVPSRMSDSRVIGEQYGQHHLKTQPFDGEQPIPIFVGDTERHTTHVGSHREYDGVLVIGLGQFLLGLAKKIPDLLSYSIMKDKALAREKITADVVELLRMEDGRVELAKPSRSLLDLATLTLRTQVASYEKIHHGESADEQQPSSE